MFVRIENSNNLYEECNQDATFILKEKKKCDKWEWKGIIYNAMNHLLWLTVNQIIKSTEYCCASIRYPWVFRIRLCDIKNNKRNYWYVIQLNISANISDRC